MSYKLTQTGQEVQALLNQIKNGGQSQVTDAVLYTPQNLEEKEQEQARKNIGAAAENQIPTGAVLYSQKQDLESNQKAQARTNIGAVGPEQLPTKVSELENDAHYITENQVPVALPQKTGAIQSGVLPTTGWNTLDEGWKENTLPADSMWWNVTYGNGKFVAVARDSTNGAYSTDGITWTEMRMPASSDWRSVICDNEKFVAVASGSANGAYSTDGINWVSTTMPTSQRWQSAAYGNGKFVAVAGSGDKGAYSTDGITWAEMSMPTSQSWQSVTYGDGKFVAVAYNSKKGAYSTDGITWTEMRMPIGHNWRITYGNGKFVAVAVDWRDGAYSTDGITWTKMLMPASRFWESVTYGDGKFVAVPTDSNKGAYSTDGITWTEMSLPAGHNGSSVAYGDGKFVVVSSGANGAYWDVAGTPIYTISDTSITANSDILMELTDEGGVKSYSMEAGKITVIRDAVPTQPIPYTYKVKQTNASGQFTLVNHFVPNVPTKTSELTNDSGFITSSDIPTSVPVSYKKVSGELPTSGWISLDEGWKQNTLPANTDWKSVTYGDGKYVAVAFYSDKGAYSTDGITWTEMSMPAVGSWIVTYGNGKYVAVASGNTNGAYSTDGINWTEMNMPASRSWNGLTYGNGKFVAVAASSDKGAYSTDGITWIEMSMPSSRDWASVTYGDGKFVAVVVDSLYGAYSTDGITWTEMSMSASRIWRRVTYGNGKFVAVAYISDKGAYSTDGITWTEMSMPTSRSWIGVTYGDDKFVAVAYNSDKGAYSIDGITWTETTLPSSIRWNDVTYGDGKFVAVAQSSANGAYWKAAADVTYTISDIDITANTSVKMYLTDEGGVKSQSKANGSITVIRDTVPTTPIPYEYEVEQTSAEGLFEVINAYVPTKTSELTNDSGFITQAAIPTKVSQLANDSGFTDNIGTITQIKINGEVKEPKPSGLIDLGNITPEPTDWTTVPITTALENGKTYVVKLDTTPYPLTAIFTMSEALDAIDANVVGGTQRGTDGASTYELQSATITVTDGKLTGLKSTNLVSNANPGAANLAYSESTFADLGITQYHYVELLNTVGGGSAASITYTKLAGGVHFESSYQSASNAFFVNADAATWTTLGGDGPKALTSTSDLGLIVGDSYKIYVNIDGTEKSFSGTVADGASALGVSGSKILMLDDGEQGFVIYDHCDFSQGYPQNGNGSIIIASLSSSPTSAKITSFTGTLRTVSPATITNPAIKINSAVTMYINSDIILEGTKTDGSLTLSASDGGSVAYEMEILDTPTEGLFEVVNNYIPTPQPIPVALPQQTSVVKTAKWTKGETTVSVTDSDITETSDVVVNIFYEGSLEISGGKGGFTIESDVAAGGNRSFEYKIKQTNNEGQFTVVNQYTPSTLPIEYEYFNGVIDQWESKVPEAFFIGQDATKWSGPDGGTLVVSASRFGLIVGNQYTLTANVNNTAQTFTATAILVTNEDFSFPGLDFNLGSDQHFVIYDCVAYENDNMTSGSGSIVMLMAGVSSFVVTAFEGERQKQITATITNSWITTNSAVTMYVNSPAVLTGVKTDGQIVLTTDRATPVNYSIEIFDTSTEGMFKIINSYIPSAPPSIISKTITNTSSNISITGTSEPYLCTITDSDVTTANFVRLYPLDEDTETWLNDNTSSSIITESSGKFTFKVTTNALPQTFTMKYFIQ
jgi:hypothetical protein